MAITIISISLMAVMLMTILYAIADKDSRYRNNFTRSIISDIIEQQNILDTKGDYYIAGITKDQIFLGNRKDSLDLLITDINLNHAKHIRLTIQNEPTIHLRETYIEIDSPFFYIKDGGAPGIFQGRMGYWTAQRILAHTPYFTQAVRTAEKSFTIQSIGNKTGNKVTQNALSSVSGTSGIKSNVDIFGEDTDFLTSSGLLRYSRKLNKLVYIYFYKNEYLLMDTSLNLAHKYKVIDPTAQANLKPIEIKEGRFSLASPKSFINNTAQVYEQWLLINSTSKASNETTEAFDNASIIDVYDLETGQYTYSFYIPDYDGIKLENFKAVNHQLIGTFKNHVISYSLNKKAFKDRNTGV